MWTQAHIIWKHRCEALHGKKKAQENLTANVHELYKPKDKLRAKDMTILDRPFDDVLAMTHSNMKLICQGKLLTASATREAIIYGKTTTQYLQQMMKKHL